MVPKIFFDKRCLFTYLWNVEGITFHIDRCLFPFCQHRLGKEQSYLYGI